MYQSYFVFLTLSWIVSVSSTQVYTTEKYVDRNINISVERPKRQDDPPWIWGYADYTKPNLPPRKPSEPQKTEPQETTTEINPCDLPKLTMPDFSAPGRRISVKKCYEYIWNIKYREDKAEKDIACTIYRIKHRGPNGPYFAIGGRNADPGEFPHMAALGWKAAIGTWVFKCGSSLISNKFVLTAAHCTKASPLDTEIDSNSLEPKIVRLGDKNIIDVWSNGQPPNDVNISKIFVHPLYKAPKKYFDIALMELAVVVTFNSNVQPACLWTRNDNEDLADEATVTGWGVVKSNSYKISPILQVVVLDLINSQQCDALLRPMCNRQWCGIQDHQICAGKLAGGVDSCRGDSGGPLQVKISLPTSSQGAMHHVVGVTSFGFGCALANSPGVYTRVSSFIDWIENIVWR